MLHIPLEQCRSHICAWPWCAWGPLPDIDGRPYRKLSVNPPTTYKTLIPYRPELSRNWTFFSWWWMFSGNSFNCRNMRYAGGLIKQSISVFTIKRRKKQSLCSCLTLLVPPHFAREGSTVPATFFEVFKISLNHRSYSNACNVGDSAKAHQRVRTRDIYLPTDEVCKANVTIFLLSRICHIFKRWIT